MVGSCFDYVVVDLVVVYECELLVPALIMLLLTSWLLMSLNGWFLL